MIYAISYCTESFDRDVLFVDMETEPTDDEVNALLCEQMPNEYEWCGYIGYDITPVQTVLPKPTAKQIKYYRKQLAKFEKG